MQPTVTVLVLVPGPVPGTGTTAPGTWYQVPYMLYRTCYRTHVTLALLLFYFTVRTVL
jgi:hypothetical protein